MKNIIYKIPLFIGIINLFGYSMYHIHDILKDVLLKEIIFKICFIFQPSYMVLGSGFVSSFGIVLSIILILRKKTSIRLLIISVAINVLYIILNIYWILYSA